MLQWCFLEQGVSDAHNAALDICTDEVDRKDALHVEQTTLDRSWNNYHAILAKVYHVLDVKLATLTDELPILTDEF